MIQARLDSLTTSVDDLRGGYNILCNEVRHLNTRFDTFDARLAESQPLPIPCPSTRKHSLTIFTSNFWLHYHHHPSSICVLLGLCPFLYLSFLSYDGFYYFLV